MAAGGRNARYSALLLRAWPRGMANYWASTLEAKLCADQEVGLVGAGNSAG